MSTRHVSTGHADRFREVARTFTGVVARVPDWDAPTPVAQWRARDVVGHLTGWVPGFVASGSDVTLLPGLPGLPGPPGPPGPPAADDPGTAWAHLRDAVQAVLDDPRRAGAGYRDEHLGAGTVGAMLDRVCTTDVLWHAWDLSRAAGLPDPIEEPAAVAMLAGLEPQEEMLRASGQFGTRQPVTEEHTAVERLMAFLGRDPDWRRP